MKFAAYIIPLLALEALAAPLLNSADSNSLVDRDASTPKKEPMPHHPRDIDEADEKKKTHHARDEDEADKKKPHHTRQYEDVE